MGVQGPARQQAYWFVCETNDGRVVVRDEAGICHLGEIAHVVVRLERHVASGDQDEEVLVFGPTVEVG